MKNQIKEINEIQNDYTVHLNIAWTPFKTFWEH